MAKEFKFEKEYQKDPRICKRCGKQQDYACIGGLCDQCQKIIIQERSQQRNKWIVTEKEAKELGVR